jgi:hypothetical protein
MVEQFQTHTESVGTLRTILQQPLENQFIFYDIFSSYGHSMLSAYFDAAAGGLLS